MFAWAAVGRITHRGARVLTRRATSYATHTADHSHSLVAAIEAESKPQSRLLVRCGYLVFGYWAYNYVARAYAFMLLGSAATEQLFMQRLEDKVELEMVLQPFSSIGVMRGMLTPVAENPRTSGPMNHRAFTILEPANVSSRTLARHTAAAEQQLPPVPTTRHCSVFAPMPLSALLRPSEERLFIRKDRSGTQYFSKAPPDWGGWPGLSHDA